MEKLDLTGFKISEQNLLKHEGVVAKVSENFITVALKGDVNCEGCKAKSACGVLESNDKKIEIFDVDNSFRLHESVNVVLEKQLGLKAVFWAYVFPFILMMSMLILSSFFLEEWISGLLSLFVLIPYYFMLHFFNNSFKKTFKISVLKIN